MNSIRNFCIIAHIDHGKSTLADRLLELTGTVEKRKMQEQYLDTMDLERERGITIKLAPARMRYRRQLDRGQTRTGTRTDADTGKNDTNKNAEELLYADVTYKIRGAVFSVRKELGLGHKEPVYHKALKKEFDALGLSYESEPRLTTMYKGEHVGTYTPDFVVEEKILVELKALPEIGRPQQEQVWSYLKGSEYKLALLVNFGTTDVDIRRIVYDTARPESSGQRVSASSLRKSAGVSDQIEEYILNLIDTPGHADFGYEVSRSLAAVEGAILLVDASQGVQAQTLANVHAAFEQDLTIIPVMNKIDLPNADVQKTRDEIVQLIGGDAKDILAVSAKTGEGVEELLAAVIERVPPPRGSTTTPLRALVFDSLYDSYRGVVAYIRVVDGSVAKGDRIRLYATGKESEVIDVGIFSPAYVSQSALPAGTIGYVVTGLKDLFSCRVGDTMTTPAASIAPLSGYKEVKPMVFAGVFPKDASDTEGLRNAVEKLNLNDAAFHFEPERSEALGVGFRCGFLGLLHLDIIRERIEREYDLAIVVTVPSVGYRVTRTNGDVLMVRSATAMPDTSGIRLIEEPWVSVDIITQGTYLGGIMQLAQDFRAEYVNTEYLGAGDAGRAILHYRMPLSQILVDFYDKLKSVSQGYASLNYEFLEYRSADVRRMDILVAEQPEESLATIVYADDAHAVGKRIVRTLKESIPPKNFVVKLQAAIGGKIVASERIQPYRKDVTAKLYGGDVTRKRKLLEKQKKGKKKMAHLRLGGVDIPPEAYLNVLKR